MKRIGVLAVMICLWLSSYTVLALPEGAVARLGKGIAGGIDFSSDGRMLAVATSIGVYLYDLNTLMETVFFDMEEWIVSVAFSPDGRLLATRIWDGWGMSGHDHIIVKVWDVPSGKEVATLRGHAGSSVSSVAFSPDGRLLAGSESYSNFDNTVKLWDVSSWQEVATLGGHIGDVYSLAFSPDGRLLASGFEGMRLGDNVIKLWDVSNWKDCKAVAILGGHIGDVYSLAFSPDGRLLASGGGYYDETILLWDVPSWQEVATLGEHAGGVYSLAFSQDSRLLASRGSGGVKLWDIPSYKEVATLKEYTRSVTLSPDGRLLAIGVYGGVKLWDVPSWKEVATLGGHAGSSVSSVAFSPDRVTLASGGSDGVKLWDIPSYKEVTTLKQNNSSLAFSPDGRLLATSAISGGGWDRTVKLWDVSSWKEVVTLGEYIALAFSPDGRLLASGKLGGVVKLWDVSSWKEVVTLGRHEGISSLAFSPDGRLLASGSGDRTVKLWDVVKWQEIATLSGHSGGVSSLAFSPDGRLLASGSGDRTVKLWDVVKWQEIATLSGHSGGVSSLAFSPDGRLLASLASDGTRKKELGGEVPGLTVTEGIGEIKLWDTRTRQEVATLWGGHLGQISLSLAFSLDGSLLASGSSDGTILLWDMTPYTASFNVMPKGKCLTTWGEVKVTKLFQNYPNPFNPETWIPYQLAEESPAVIRIYDTTGGLVQKLELGKKPTGLYLSRENAAYWDGCDENGESVASGVYFYTISAGSFHETKKMAIVR